MTQSVLPGRVVGVYDTNKGVQPTVKCHAGKPDQERGPRFPKFPGLDAGALGLRNKGSHRRSDGRAKVNEET